MDWFTAPEYWLGRLIFQRALAGVYLAAFAGAALQFRALIGAHGMLPVPRHVRHVPPRRAPSLFRLHYSDRFFAACAWTGAALAAALAAGAGDAVPLGAAMAMWAVLWLLYLSIVNVGQTWYSFGWESLLLEAGFLAVFLGNARTGPPVLVLWLLRWAVFRVEFGAGLIKMRGDACWRKLTCLYFHHETQPMPGPLSWFFHHLPKPVHRMECAANHVTQLVVPVLLFAPQPVASYAALAIVATQLWLVLSGNFAWLNWLTIALAVPAVDFTRLSWLPVPGADAGRPPEAAHREGPLWYAVLVCALTALVLVLSRHPVANMLSRRQVMNRSFDPLHLVNSYGAFGTVGRIREEVVVEGTADRVPAVDGAWREYGFKGKPGDVRRTPRQFAPYHLRLDWLMWFAALSPDYARDWFGPFVERLLAGDRDTLRLIRHNPFPDAPPRYVRARLYRYRFTTWRELRETGAWWHRTLVREYMPPTRLAAAPGSHGGRAGPSGPPGASEAE
ncbi:MULTISPECIES: lipase maturation factor family protein [unclassified Streptomyces]|uniref:lipase maturation factor family protein n=1 Tax=unclassified Streptomyces TaxID=2593676 RepID=UPI000DC7D9A5|nr:MULTISPECIES: lipase maturation factor family protein [unclassified Streptomyces]AWZ04251.1 lipase maturation factor family protein [Streptomyces sp. ICC4]AWZ11861.1 lipase maturation factor family protein [Streptomyces sp. ICC1]